MSIFNENDRKLKKLRKLAVKIAPDDSVHPKKGETEEEAKAAAARRVEQELKRAESTEKPKFLEQKYAKMKNEELMGMTAVFKKKLADGAKLDDIMLDAYAVVMEASKRVLNMKHFFVQLMGGIALHQSRIVEMATGEGKTLVATLPAYLNALEGKGVHIVTVNDYLARRDADWMDNLFRFLGLTVGVVVHGMTREEKQKAYAADITYCSNSELGFDFLRDNMALKKEDVMQRELNFAIIDEVDSILIDEARTPLIISNVSKVEKEDLLAVARFVDGLKEAAPVLDVKGAPVKDEDGNEKTQGEVEVDYEKRTAILTEEGLSKAEKYFKTTGFFGKSEDGKEADGTGDIDDAGDAVLYNRIEAALKAKFLFLRDRDYLVDEGKKVVIIDHNTGRAMPGRRFNDGLHQAIEAKEALLDSGVKILGDNKIAATITYQNLFRQYAKISGMTGTAKTEETEFKNIYKLDVVKIPPHADCRREDKNDKMFLSKAAKFDALILDISERYAKGQPMLIGTTSVEESEMLSAKLAEKKIPHEVLNAKNNKNEAYIIAQAGAPGAVTISTNMAGRGTDILLGGNPEYHAKKNLEDKLDGMFKDKLLKFDNAEEGSERYSDLAKEELERVLAADREVKEQRYETFKSAIIDSATTKYPVKFEMSGQYAFEGETYEVNIKNLRDEYEKDLQEIKAVCDVKKQDVISKGGLCVIGTGRNESRRIDNQLIGRAGRQGDIGQSEFYVSLEDDILRFNNSERLAQLLTYLKMRIPEDQRDLPLQLKVITNFIKNTQKKIEGLHFAARRDLLYYDEVLEVQRNDIYSARKMLLNDEDDIHAQVEEMFERLARSILEKHIDPNEGYDKWDIEGLTEEIEKRMMPKRGESEEPDFDEDAEEDDEAFDEEDEFDEDESEENIVVEHEDDDDYTFEKEDPESKKHIFKKGSVITQELCETGDVDAIVKAICAAASAEYAKKAEFYKERNFDYGREEKFVLQTNIDRMWPDFLDKNNSLRESVRLRAYGQHDPRIVFRKESMDMFDKLLDKIYLETAGVLLTEAVPRSFYMINLREAEARASRLRSDINVIFNDPKGWAPSDRSEIKQATGDEFLLDIFSKRAEQIVAMTVAAAAQDRTVVKPVEIDRLADMTLFVKKGEYFMQKHASADASREELVSMLGEEAKKQARAALISKRQAGGERRVDALIAMILGDIVAKSFVRCANDLNRRNTEIALDGKEVDKFLNDCEQIYDIFYKVFVATTCINLFGALEAELRVRQGKKSGGNTIVGSRTPGRNDPCPCGSGKKYKNCCGKNA